MYQSSVAPKTMGQLAKSKSGCGAKMKAERRQGWMPMGATPASAATWSTQAPAALSSTGAR